MPKQRILIMAGGTGGHVFPGLALAKALQENHKEVLWLGTKKGIESHLVPEAGLAIQYMSISGIRGKKIHQLCMAPWRLIKAILESIKIIKQYQPDLVIGLGGFVSGPGGIAAWLLRKKLIIHEQNAKPGLTNQYLAKLANHVLTGFPNTFGPSVKNIQWTGNPVRQELIQFKSPDERQLHQHQPMRLLIFGGSGGAKAINELVPKALAQLAAQERPEVYHQTGESLYQVTLNAYQTLGLKAKIVPFIHRMNEAYAWADVVICRAGALTIAELCATGLGAILVPYPYAVDDHQTANANYMEKNKAAILIQQSDLDENKLAKLIRELNLDPEKRMVMSKAAYALRQAQAVEKILQICEETLH